MNPTPRQRFAERIHDATVAEIAAEKAASLGRAGRRLEAALDTLRDAPENPLDPEHRERLVDQAGEALYFLLVQREACGLLNAGEIIEEYRVPREVQLRAGLSGRKRRAGAG